jgi:5-methylcytosine-specific restriction endonuclease McrA
MPSIAHARTYPSRRPAPLLLLRERIAGEAEPEGEHAPASPSPAREPEAASDWMHVHERLVSLGKTRAAHEREVCRWLLAAQRLGVHARVGYASLAELAERVLGLNGRKTEERLRVGRALGDLRVLDGALAAGELPWSAVRELTRVATRENQQAWLDWARGRRVREIEVAVAARKPGDGPRDLSDPSRVTHRLVFEVRGETMAMFRDMQSAVRADLGGKVDDDALLYEIARRVLGGPGDDGRASYQVAVSRCDECRCSRIDAAGASYHVDDVVVEMAICDGQLLEPGADARIQDAEREPSRGGSRRELPRGARDERHRVGAGRPPATQTIPAATRREVMRRDHKRCVVPGCSNHRYLDVHHLDPRCEGGGHDPERLAVLCGAHHRAVHAGVLCIDGTGSSSFGFRHGDGTPYGGGVGVLGVDVARQALGALEKMGFKPTQARVLVDDALRAGAQGDVAALLRAALRAT